MTARGGGPLIDIYGQVVQVKPGTREAALGRSQLYGICVRTRRGVKGFEATWYPSGNTATFAGKRGATAFVKAHENAFYALSRNGADAPAQNDGAEVACLWCAGSDDIVTDADAQLCRDHLAEFDGVSVAQLDRQDAAAVADLI